MCQDCKGQEAGCALWSGLHGTQGGPGAGLANGGALELATRPRAVLCISAQPHALRHLVSHSGSIYTTVTAHATNQAFPYPHPTLKADC